MKNKLIILIVTTFVLLSCVKKTEQKNISKAQSNTEESQPKEIPKKNILVIDAVKKFGPHISSTYQKAVCTELVIQIIEKFHPLENTDKNRIRIITVENIQDLLKTNSPIPKGVYYALIEKKIGFSIEQEKVLEGDFVQFWTETWGHCGIVKSINPEKKEMELYSSFPSTNGYGIQKFSIPEYSFFVRLK
ncbi:hypothetical protein J2X31_003619 [Flavobacterium arsenatis]|uniref:Peptidase C51 domain-containing protein n=1 Tax=Flavobacterium arsenatis TaxID=1484332 RepID=A0ABU1TUN4_9FLAO|nr:hypothetical protein [Flavobacterium arsenatis]MDR6969586.1 hypothetical protein [Flavobacterium arsenatis]